MTRIVLFVLCLVGSSILFMGAGAQYAKQQPAACCDGPCNCKASCDCCVCKPCKCGNCGCCRCK